jgi:hypothetical protein
VNIKADLNKTNSEMSFKFDRRIKYRDDKVLSDLYLEICIYTQFPETSKTKHSNKLSAWDHLICDFPSWKNPHNICRN